MTTNNSQTIKRMKWFFEPGHSAAEFRARHMMVTWVRGSFKNVQGKLDFDPANPRLLAVETVIDTSTCWTGVDARDAHLRSPDFLSCERYPKMSFKSTGVSQIGPVDYRVTGDLTIRDVTRPVTLDVRYLGTWETPWWEDGVDKGPKTRVGFTARARIDRYDFGVNWNDQMPDGGVVVSPQIDIVIDVEAIRED
jgi:polyisoprenoid-binding protein YceI